MENSTKISTKIDWLLILLFLVIVGAGFFNLYSSDFKPNDEVAVPFFQNTYGRQLIWIGVSFLVIFFIMMLDTVVFSMFAYVIYLVVVGILFMVLVIGSVTHGAQSWIEIGSFKIQPSELAKFATALAVSKYISSNGFKFTYRNRYDVFVTLGIIFLPVLLILLQPDVGSAIIYVTFIFVLYREGLPGIFLWLIFVMIVVFVSSLILNSLIIVLTITTLTLLFLYFIFEEKRDFIRIILVLAVPLLVFNGLNLLLKININPAYVVALSVLVWAIYMIVYFLNKRIQTILIVMGFMFTALIMHFSTDIMFNKILKPHQRNRIDVLFDNTIAPRGIGYNLRQSKIAIGSGGWSGKGYLQGTQTKLNFVPEHNTDFIFCTVAEEWGFVGAVGLFLLYATLIIRLIFRAEKQISTFSRVYGYSVASIFFIHFFVNIGMTIGLLPVIGIPLPFFSYGGSSMLGFTILLFIFIKLDTEKDLKI